MKPAEKVFKKIKQQSMAWIGEKDEEMERPEEGRWKKREAKRDAVSAMEKSPVRNQMRLRLRGRSAEMKRNSRTKTSRTNKNGSSITENFLTKIKESPSELEGLKNKERIKFNTGGIKYRRSIGFQGLVSGFVLLFS
ncbi:hypothetical protein J1N35_043569 [Gossypium stocksii]|uniref:Uncharacterized protein n=1 Tax=Gossypium stocksii TaxID=47602 RepID=A0A9D3U7V4_9ROSI|nr:hypothetical protein J1N35_043569 [Gossypium stocksii]